MTRTMHHYSVFLLFALLIPVRADAQSKKDIIAAQAGTIDSLLSVCEQQHNLILKAQTRIEDVHRQNIDLEKDLAKAKVRTDTLRAQLERQKRATDVARLLRPFLTPPTSNPRNGVLERRDAYIHFSSAEHLDHVILETKGVDLLTGITTLRVVDGEYATIFESGIQTTTIGELDVDPELLRCIVTRRLSDLLTPHTLVPVALDRNTKWRIISDDLVAFVPDVQTGILLSTAPGDPQSLLVYDRTSKQVIRITDPQR